MSRSKVLTPSTDTVLWPGRWSTVRIDPASIPPVTCQKAPVVLLVTVTSSAGPRTVMTGQASTSPVLSAVSNAHASDAPSTRGRKGNHSWVVSSWSTSTVNSLESSQYGHAARNRRVPALTRRLISAHSSNPASYTHRRRRPAQVPSTTVNVPSPD